MALQSSTALLPSTTCWGVGTETISGGSANKNHRHLGKEYMFTSLYSKRAHITALW